MGGKIEGKIYLFLAEGKNLSETARMAKKSPAAILKRARKYVGMGLLQRIARGRYTRVEKGLTLPPISQSPSLPEPIMLPVKFGLILAQVRKPKLKYDEYGKAYEKTALYECQFGKRKAQLWLKGGFKGITQEEQLQSGKQMLLDIAAMLSNKHGIELTPLRFYEGIEWVDPSQIRSATTAKGAGMKKGEKIEVDGAIHKYSDSSHPDQFQINPKHGGVQTRATEQAKYRIDLYSGEYERRFQMVFELEERAAKNILALSEKLEEVKVRMDMEAKKRG